MPMKLGRSRGAPKPLARLRHRRRWWVTLSAPASTAVLFLLGSSLFLFASIARLSVKVCVTRLATRLMVLTPYFLGSICYTLGCSIPVHRTLYQWRSAELLHQKASLKNDKELARARAALSWARLDFLGACWAVTGGVLINLACFLELFPLRASNERVFWQITLPTLIGRAFFMAAGYLSWAARNASLSFSVRNASVRFWQASVLFLVGTGGFYVGWFFTASPLEVAPGVLVHNWFWILLGNVAGSCCLLAASYVMFLEATQAAPSQVSAGEFSLPEPILR